MPYFYTEHDKPCFEKAETVSPWWLGLGNSIHLLEFLIMGISRRFAMTRSALLDFAHDGRRSGALMLAAAVLGLLLANLPATEPLYRGVADFRIVVPLPELTMGLGDWARDGLLAVFFLVVGLDLKCELTTGSLSRVRDALVPVIAAVGGVLAPILLYLLANAGSPSTLSGWTVPTATDIAFSVAVLAMAGGKGASRLAPFLTTLAVADDVIGILLIAVVYSHGGRLWALIPLALCLLAWWLLARMEKPICLLMAPVALVAWYMALLSGIHPTIAGVVLGLLAPGRPMHAKTRVRAERWSNAIGPFSSLIVLPVFAFFAMGVSLHGMNILTLASPIFLGVFFGLVIGKPLGVTLAGKACHLCGLGSGRRPLVRSKKGTGTARIAALEEMGMAQLCGIGFTVAFLMADLAFADPVYSGIAKIGVLAGSITAALIGSSELLIAGHRKHSNE